MRFRPFVLICGGLTVLGLAGCSPPTPGPPAPSEIKAFRGDPSKMTAQDRANIQKAMQRPKPGATP
jgi:hypothetical protein